MSKEFWKKVFLGLAVVILALGIGILILTHGGEKKEAEVVATNFVGYDFARAVMGDDARLEMLLRPGAEAHSFEPTPEDIAKIREAELFIYVGGESDAWVEEMLRDNEIPAERTLRLMDLVEVKDEEIVEGMEEEDAGEDEIEKDEHIWTSPVNAMKLVQGIEAALTEIEPGRTKEYHQNAEEYIAKLEQVDADFLNVVEDGVKDELIFADRFPFRYFVDEYGLKYFAAFPGCAEQTEASSKTIAFLIDKVREDNIEVILKMELSDDKLAQTIAKETGAKVMELDAAHNISADDFAAGRTYAEIMAENVKVLAEALK